MSGHSKWANIKRQKQATDAARGQAFTKVARAISLAARKGGADSSLNSALRMALEKARAVNMPKENIERAIGAGEAAANLEEAVYEGYGPGGVAFYLKTLTDNRNRTVSELRRIFELQGGKLASAGAAAYIFQDPEKPSFTVPVLELETAKKVLALADSLDEHADVQDVYSNFEIPEDLLAQIGRS